MISARNVSANIGSSEVLRGIDLDVASGQMLAVLGANGAGKTSLLRTLSNLIVAKSGEIRFNGEPTRGRSAHSLARLGLVHVPQGRQIIAQLSVLDNLLIGAHQTAAPGADTEALLAREFARFPVLRERRDVMGGALSGGEQQMLAVSRGLMMQPKVLMLDEPSLGLAPQVVRLILRSLRDLANDGLAVILVEQAATLALEHCDDAIILRNGECAMQGSTASIKGSQDLVNSYLS
ncbi:ABC transporter ATP-binding protein [soil metagenome]